jgi:probable rRNA maturation factor
VSGTTLAVVVQDASGGGRMPPPDKIREWATLALGAEARGELTIRIVSKQESAELNQRYRGKRGPTNVLSFPSDLIPQPAGAELLPLGDLVVCAPVLARESAEQGKTLDAHWAHIVIHGVLHLQGFDHETDEQAAVMEGREREILAGLGFKDPYAT